MLITSSAERNAKYRREQEFKRAMFALGNPTVDQKYITDFGNSASKFISDSAKGVSGVAFGQSQQALDRYNAQAQRLKYQKLVIEDFLERNAEKGSYTELQNALNNIQNGIDNVGNAYINTHNMMSQYKTEDEYNRDKITSQHVGSTYDEILAEINRLGDEQKNQTPETAAETQKNRDVLNNLLYNNNYIERDSYQKAIADIDRQIAETEKTIGKPPVGMVARSVYDAKNGEAANKINYLKTLKSTLEEKEKITEFTELPAKLGEHNFQIGVSNGKIKGQYNPTADQLRQWMQKYVDSSYDEQAKMLDEKPEIVDPLGFVEQNPDLWVQEGQNSRLSNIFLTEIYNHAKEYHWDEITPEEKDIYYFTLNRLGKDKAMEYLSLLERYFGQRYAADITKSIEEFTDKAGWLGGTFINIALIPVSMIGNAEAALDGFSNYVSGEGINPYSSANRLRLGTTAIRSGTAKEWGKAADWELFGKNVFEQSFNILMSTGESLFGGLALGPAYMFFAGSGAAMSTAQDIYDRGGSANQIFFGALASGIAEAVFEKISIDRLLSGAESITGFKEMFKQILTQGGVEASEEVLTEMANTISDNLIMAEKSTVSLRVKELMDENPSMTPTEARKKAETEVVTEVIWAGLSGFISGGLNIGVTGTTGIVANKFDQKKQSVATQQIIGNQLKSDGTAEAFINFAISQGLVKDGTTVDSLSSEALGKVYQDFCDKFYETASKSKTSAELLSVVEKYNTEETPNVVKRYVGAVAATVLAEHPEWAPETSEATTVDVDGVVDDSADGVEATEESVLPNVSAVAPEADPIKDDAFAARGLERLTEEQRLLKSIGETLGRKVEFRNLDKWVKDPETGKRRRVSPGGMINKTTGVLYLNSSKYAYQNALREVLKHEITHFAEVDTEAYALLQKGIMDSQVFKDWVKRKGYKGTVNEDGYAVSATSNMNAAYIKRYAESGLEGTEVFKGKDAEDAANREMVADFVAENLFTDDMSRLRDALSDVQPETVNKFKQWILDLLKKLKNAFRSQAKVYESIEGIESEFVKVCKSAQRIWEQNHKQTAEQQKNNEEGNEISPDTEGVTVNAKGEPVVHSVGDGTVQFSLSTYETDGRSQLREYLEKCVSSNRLTQAEMDEMLDGIEEIYDICKEFKDKYAPFGSWSDAAVVRDTHGKPVFSVVTPNGEYKMNLDFSLVCKKRRTLDAVFNLMADEGILDEFELGQKSIVKINEIIRKYGFETACSLCFVDAKRFRQADVADSFVNLYNELVESLVPESERDSISRFDFSERGLNKEGKQGIDTWDNSRLDFSHLNKVMKEYGSKTVEHKAAKYIKSHPEARKLLIRGEFMSSEDFGNVKTKAPEIMKLYNSKKGTGGPKAAFGDVQYLNEIIKKARNWTPNKAYMVGGVRIQSFSDYVPRMIFDYVQMIYDLAATKLPAHAYTKEVLFVKQFGLTGIKINMSLIPAIAEDGIAPGLDKNGNYVWAGESFDYDAAMEIQNAEGYTENCGTIAVGVSKEHILKLLRDPNIRMVIPYHKSGLNPIVAHMNKIDAFTDYTTLKTNPGGCQNTIDNKTGSAVKNDFNFNKALHDMRENGSPKAVAKQYLDWCAENNYMPKFAEFSKNANYYKLLEDFNLYDKSGKYAPQREVRAVFPTEGSAFSSMKELIKQGLEEDAIIEGKRNEDLPKIVDEVKRTLPKTEAEISEDAVKQATTDLEAGLQYSLPQSDYRYSLPDNKDRLLEMYETGQITKEQLFEALENKPQKENPASIAKLKPEDASTTPELKKKTGENKGDSESKFYESAMKSSIFDESFKNDIKDDSYIQSYNRITNKETLKKAADMLDEGGQAGVTAWFAKPLDTVSLTDIAMGLILMDRYQRVGDYQSAAAAAQRVRMMGTSSGQQVQIFSILGRFTPEGMVHYAQKELDQAYQKFIDTKAKKWAEKNADKFKLTPEDIEKIRRNTLQATALPEDSRARAILLAEICSLVQNKIPPTFADSIRAWQRTAMLLNVRTNIRNILGNAGMAPVFIASDFFGTFVDKAIARTTGVRTTGNFSIKGSGKAFAKGFYESLDDFRRDVHTRQEELNRFEFDGFKGREAPGKNFNAGTRSAVWNKMADILNGLDRFTSFCLEAGDRTFFEMWVNNSLNNQMRLNNVTEPTPEMLLAATEEALQRTWQDNSQMARVVSKLKQTMNIANIGGYGLGDVLVKFTKTPANIAKAIVDFSPAGFIFATKNIVQIRQAFEKGQLTPAMQNKAVKSMSNAITGTLIYLLVTALASAGVIRLSGDSDDDKDVSNFERYIVGIPPYSMEFFGVNITYDWMQPFGSALAIVSEYMENKKDKSTGLGDDLVQAVMAGGEVFTKQSFLQSLYEFFSNSDENFIMGLSQAVASDPSVFIPQLISQTASIIDPKRRMTYDNNFWKNSLNQVISKIPGLRMLLPEQVNVMGETIENNQFLNPWLAFVAPYNTYPDSYGKTAEKIYDLYKTTGDKEVIPRSAPKNFSVKGHKYSFTQKQKQEFQRDMGQASAEMLDIFFKSKEYQKLNDAQKVDVIKSIYGYSTKLAKFNVVKNDYDYALLSDIIGYKDEEETQPILTKSKYDSLSQKAKIQIVEEGIFTTKERALKNYNEAVKYFISKTK